MDFNGFTDENYKIVGKYKETLDKYQSLINTYERVAVPYRGMCDEIKRIVICVSRSLYKNNSFINKQLIDSFSIYKCINSIEIDGNYCSISFFEDGVLKNIKFRSVFFDEEYERMCYTTEELMEKYSNVSVNNIKNLVGTYKYSADCHFASLEFLKKYRDRNLRAITSICNTISGYSFFHSYILDCDTNFVYDISRNIVMDKESFDYLFTLIEVSSLSYSDYLKCSEMLDENYFQKLFYIALRKLNNNEESKREFQNKLKFITSRF